MVRIESLVSFQWWTTCGWITTSMGIPNSKRDISTTSCREWEMCLECPEIIMGIIVGRFFIILLISDDITTMTLLQDWHDRWYIFLSHIHHHSHDSVMERERERKRSYPFSYVLSSFLSLTFFLGERHITEREEGKDEREKSAKTYERKARTWRTKAKSCHLMAWVHQKESSHQTPSKIGFKLEIVDHDGKEWLMNRENTFWGRDYQSNWINLHLHIIPYWYRTNMAFRYMQLQFSTTVSLRWKELLWYM